MNIDYPLGLAAYNVLSEVAEHVGSVLGVYIIGKAATFGVWILMLGFGASFGLTVMARLSLFIGRILFLLKNWVGLPWLTG